MTDYGYGEQGIITQSLFITVYRTFGTLFRRLSSLGWLDGFCGVVCSFFSSILLHFFSTFFFSVHFSIAQLEQPWNEQLWYGKQNIFIHSLFKTVYRTFGTSFWKHKCSSRQTVDLKELKKEISHQEFWTSQELTSENDSLLRTYNWRNTGEWPGWTTDNFFLYRLSSKMVP